MIRLGGAHDHVHSDAAVLRGVCHDVQLLQEHLHHLQTGFRIYTDTEYTDT